MGCGIAPEIFDPDRKPGSSQNREIFGTNCPRAHKALGGKRNNIRNSEISLPLLKAWIRFFDYVQKTVFAFY